MIRQPKNGKKISNMHYSRCDHTASLLSNGKVLVTGGESNEGPDVTRLCELYDPLTGNWTKTGSKHIPRTGHTASVLLDGKVLITSGNGIPNEACEVYDPLTEKWTLTSSMHDGRQEHTATVLKNGSVLVTGGKGYRQILNSSELYDPSTQTWAYSIFIIRWNRISYWRSYR